jgi:hypothetical protein
MLMKFEFSLPIFEEGSIIKFHQNPSSGSRVVPCGQTDGRTDMMKSLFAVLRKRLKAVHSLVMQAAVLSAVADLPYRMHDRVCLLDTRRAPASASGRFILQLISKHAFSSVIFSYIFCTTL